MVKILIFFIAFCIAQISGKAPLLRSLVTASKKLIAPNQMSNSLKTGLSGFGPQSLVAAPALANVGASGSSFRDSLENKQLLSGYNSDEQTQSNYFMMNGD
jgi:hypothetical protein